MPFLLQHLDGLCSSMITASWVQHSFPWPIGLQIHRDMSNFIKQRLFACNECLLWVSFYTWNSLVICILTRYAVQYIVSRCCICARWTYCQCFHVSLNVYHWGYGKIISRCLCSFVSGLADVIPFIGKEFLLDVVSWLGNIDVPVYLDHVCYHTMLISVRWSKRLKNCWMPLYAYDGLSIMGKAYRHIIWQGTFMWHLMTI